MVTVPIPQVGPATIIEIVWTLMAALGGGFALFDWLDARADKKAVERNKIKNGRKRISIMAHRTARTLLTMQVLFLGVGLVAAATPSMQGGTTIIGLVAACALIYAEGLAGWASFRGLQDRRALLHSEVGKGEKHAEKEQA